MATEDINFRFIVTGNAVPQFKAVQKQVSAVDRQIKRATGSVRAHANQYSRTAVATNKWAKGALQQAGFQVGDYAVQVANGTSAMQAFGQQGSQLLGIFGPVGAVLGAAVAIFSAVGVAASKSGKEIKDMGSALGVLQEPLTSIAASVKSLGQDFGSVFPIIAQNIDTAFIAAGLFGGYMAVRYVTQMAAATVATTTFTGAMYRLGVVAGTVTKILKRFLPIAVIAGLAKLIEIFMRLVEGAGSLGNALGLLKGLAVEVFARMGKAGLGFKDLIVGVGYDMLSNWKWVLMQMAKGIQGLFGDSAQSLKNIPGLEGLALRLNNVAIAAGSSVHDAAMGMSDFESRANDAYSSAAEAVREGVKPLESWQAVKDAVAAGTKEVKIFGDAAAEAEEKSGSAAQSAADKMEDAKNRIKSVAEAIESSMESAFMSVIDGTNSAKDAFRNMASAIIKELYRVFVVKRITGFIAGLAGDVMSIAGGSFFSGIAGAPAGARAMGGPVTAGKPYLVGERGPEIVVPSRNASVIPNKDVGGGGGVVVNQTINVSTGVQQTVRTEIKSLMPQIAESAKSAVVDAKRRGGSYGRAFA